MAHWHGGTKLYQPIPFKGYEATGSVRNDCNLRWLTIKQYLPKDLSAVSFLDYGCAEGYFLWRALSEGAKKAVFIDHDDKCLKFAEGLAESQGYTDKCEFSQTLPDQPVNVAFYLDVHYNDKHPTLQEFYDKCDVLFISPSGNGRENSPKIHRELNEVFTYVEPIYNGYENRTIFRCLKEKE